MTQKMPSLKPSEIIRALEKAGYRVVRHTGSHAILWKEGITRPIPVPVHPGELKRDLLSKIFKEAGFTEDQFLLFL
ncbi:MAG: hypothetical protein A2Z02_05785 [Chloroflexi bacterium RBG_16_48_7]|nr:MAG: hypothetical protein A2Z02_05785 [Chloroflexi bacterium RBG_16_48_7]